MSSAARALGFRSLGLRLAARSPVLTAIAGHILLAIAVIGTVIHILNVFASFQVAEASTLIAVLRLAVGVLCFPLAWSLMGAAKEIHCRRNGLPVHPW